MLVRTLGIVLLVAGIASIVAIAVPSMTGAFFGSSMSIGGQPSISKDGIYYTASLCTSLPYSEAYRTYLVVALRNLPGSTAWMIKIKSPAMVRLHVYIASGCKSFQPLPLRVESFREIDESIKMMLVTQATPKKAIIVYHNLPYKASIDVTRLGGRSVTIVVVYYLPQNSFNMVALGKIVPGAQVLQQALSSQFVYNTQLWKAARSFEVYIKTAMKPRITMLSYSRALSVIVAGLLVIAVDAGLHPEHYRGKWSAFRRLAEALGLSRKE